MMKKYTEIQWNEKIEIRQQQTKLTIQWEEINKKDIREKRKTQKISGQRQAIQAKQFLS